MTRLLLAALLFVIVLTGCAPEPQYRRIDGWHMTVEQQWTQ